MKVHLLVCESQEAVKAGVSCCCQCVSVPLQPDGLQPHTHRPLGHTHLRYDWHTHLWTHPWLQHSGCGSVNTERARAGEWWQNTEIGGWNHNWRSTVHVNPIIWVKECRCGCEYSMHECGWLYSMDMYAFVCDLEAFMPVFTCTVSTCPLLCGAEFQGYGWVYPACWVSGWRWVSLLALSPSNPTLTDAAPQDSPWEQADGSPLRSLWSPKGRTEVEV